MHLRIRSGMLAAAGTALTAAVVLIGAPETAHAVPSYARQTGLACESCHTVFPQLTPFGRRFKLNGYTLTTKQGVSDINTQKQSTLSLADLPPISAMVEASTTWWNAAPNDKTKAGRVQNGSVDFPRQMSLFYAGKIADHLGAYMQITYEMASDHFTFDNTDIRYSDHTADNKWVWGVSLNNNPGVQDVWENQPGGWAFPFFKPDQYSGAKYWNGGGQPQIMGLGQTTAGVGAYGFYNNSLYFEASAYRTAIPGNGTPVYDNAYNQTATNPGPVIQNFAPYWRVSYEKDWKNNSLQFGTTGMYMKMVNDPTTIGVNNGVANTYFDAGVDAQYQYIAGDHIFELTGNYWHENQYINAYNVGTNNTNATDDLNWEEIVGTYYWQRKFGGSIGFVNQSGSRDALAYNSSSNGSINALPDTQWETLEFDYLPWLNTKLLLQYNIYNKVYGGTTFNQGGHIRSAMDNNTLMAGLWTAF